MREQFISPVLTAALRDYDRLNLLINEFDLRYDDALNGYPDYLLTALPRP